MKGIARANEVKKIAAEADKLSREICPALIQQVVARPRTGERNSQSARKAGERDGGAGRMAGERNGGAGRKVGERICNGCGAVK